MKNQFMTTQPKDKTDNVQHVDDVIRSGKGSCTVPSSNFPEVFDFFVLALMLVPNYIKQFFIWMCFIF